MGKRIFFLLFVPCLLGGATHAIRSRVSLAKESVDGATWPISLHEFCYKLSVSNGCLFLLGSVFASTTS